MIKKIFSVSLQIAFFILFSCNTTKTLNQLKYDARVESEVLIEECNRAGFQLDNFKSWYNKEYLEYTPNDSVIEALKRVYKPDQTEVVCIFGSWCGDSRREVPRFYKIADEIGFPESKITMLGVRRDKITKSPKAKSIRIERVPTFVFFVNGKEAGKVVESTENGLDKAMLEILSRN